MFIVLFAENANFLYIVVTLLNKILKHFAKEKYFRVRIKIRARKRINAFDS